MHSSNFGQFGQPTIELTALEHLKLPTDKEKLASLFFSGSFPEKYSKYDDDFTCWLSGERSLPFGLLIDLSYFQVQKSLFLTFSCHLENR